MIAMAQARQIEAVLVTELSRGVNVIQIAPCWSTRRVARRQQSPRTLFRLLRGRIRLTRSSLPALKTVQATRAQKGDRGCSAKGLWSGPLSLPGR